jgi:hypothetical protein
MGMQGSERWKGPEYQAVANQTKWKEGLVWEMEHVTHAIGSCVGETVADEVVGVSALFAGSSDSIHLVWEPALQREMTQYRWEQSRSELQLSYVT